MFYAFVSVFSFSVAGLTGSDHKVHAALISQTTSIGDTDMQKNAPASDLMTKLMNAAKIFAGFVLAVSVIVIVYGGLKYVMSQGDIRNHKGCWFIQAAGRWPWKSQPAKECVTTHLPNGLAPKMDGAQACDRYSTIVARVMLQ